MGARFDIAWNLRHAGEPAAATKLLTELASDSVRILGLRDPKVLTARAELAVCRAELGDPEGALRDLQGVLHERIAVLGK